MTLRFFFRLFLGCCILLGCSRKETNLSSPSSSESSEQPAEASDVLPSSTILTDSVYQATSGPERNRLRLDLIIALKKEKEDEAAALHLDTLDKELKVTGDNHSRLFIKKENLLGDAAFRLNDLPTALNHYLEAGKVNEASGMQDSSELVKSYVNAGVILDRQRRYEEALDAYQKVVKIAEYQSDTTSDRLARIYNNIGNALNHLQRPHEGAVYFEKALKFLEKFFPEDYAYTAKTCLYLGDAAHLQGRLQEALTWFDRAENIYTKNPPDDRTRAEILLRIANTLREKGDLEKSIEYYDESLARYQSLGNHPYYENVRAGIYHNMALTYLASREFAAAHKNLSRASEIYLQVIPGNFAIQGQLSLNSGLIFFNEGKIPEAKDRFIQAMEYYRKQYGYESPYQIYVLYALGSANEALGEWKDAERQYLSALDIALKTYGKQHYTTARTYMNLALLAKKQQNFTESLNYIQSAIQCLFAEYPGDNTFKNPAISRSLPSPGSVIKILWARADILYARGQTEADTTILQASFDTYKLTQDVVSDIRQDLSSGGSKLLMEEQNYRLYEAGIKAAWTLYELTTREEWLEEAFYMAEKSKANLLLEALKESDAKAFAGIPEEITGRERFIQGRLNLLEKKLFDAGQGNIQADSTEQVQWRQEVFALRVAYDSLKEHLEEEYPKYYQLKYDLNVAPIADIQQHLPENTGLLEFFAGDSATYVFEIEKGNFKGYKMDEAWTLPAEIASAREGMLEWHVNDSLAENDQQRLLKQYTRDAEKLYHRLLGPFHDSLPSRLVIIPDGALGYLPFETLLTEAPSENSLPDAWPYLMRSHAISYHYSSTLFNRIYSQPLAGSNRKLLAFAPEFGGKEDDATRISMPDAAFSPLLHNVEEAEEVAAIMGGKTFLGALATVDNFEKYCIGSGIIHLSSHGKADDRDARYSYIAFADPGDSAQKQLLYVSDLYNLELNAELVVLSACETGLGKLYRGEGMASLARAFTYAGAKSITTTLWQVNDEASADLMVKYYEYLDQGLPKDIALQKAKLEMVGKQNVPYFWGGFVSIGNMNSLPPSNSWIWWLVGGIMAILGIWLIGRKWLGI